VTADLYVGVGFGLLPEPPDFFDMAACFFLGFGVDPTQMHPEAGHRGAWLRTAQTAPGSRHATLTSVLLADSTVARQADGILSLSHKSA
jgi:hypothetical protein